MSTFSRRELVVAANHSHLGSLVVNTTCVEASHNGQWTTLAGLAVGNTTLLFKGRFPRIAYVHDENWLHSVVESPELCVEALKVRRKGFPLADIFTFYQKLPDTSPRYPYQMEWESLAAIRITSFEDWWNKLPQESRKNVRRSEKRGVTVCARKLDDALIRDIVDLLKDSPTRQGKRFFHFGKTFDQVKKDQSSHLDRSEFICAYFGSELIGLLKLVYVGSTASVLQFLPKASQHDKRPANALMAKGVELCAEKGIPYFVYGNFNYGNKGDTSLREFKVRNGCEEFFVPRYYVPLTVKGAFCLRLGLHRGLLSLLPRGVLMSAWKVRAGWYAFRRFPSRCSSMLERPNRTRQTERSNPPTGSTI